MISRKFFPILLAGSLFFAQCSNNAPAPAAEQEAPAAPVADTSSAVKTPDATPDTTASAAPSSTSALSEGPLPKPALQPGETPMDTTGKAAPKRPSNNEVRSDKRPSNKIVKRDSPFKTSNTAAVKKQNPAGNPTGFIGRENVGFFSEPSSNSQKISTLKIYESVVILETKMTDEAGNTYDIPQWYKVQLTSKKTGWVIGSALTLN
jgi:hypothetical protein